jgi:type VI secretion system secreted protein VgrG
MASTDFEVLEPGVSSRYNCIAHTLGIHSRWVNPRTGPANNPYMYMDRMYAQLGFRRVSRGDLSLNPGMRKIALYATVSGGRIREVTHAAVQEADGTWTSKLGQLPLIRHKSAYSLQSASYGPPVAVYVRSRSMKLAAVDETELIRDFSTTPPALDPRSPKIR